MSSLGFECLLLAVTVILFTSDFRDCLQYSKQKKSLLHWWWVKNAIAWFFWDRGKTWQNAEHCLFIQLFHLHIKQEKKRSNQKETMCGRDYSTDDNFWGGLDFSLFVFWGGRPPWQLRPKAFKQAYIVVSLDSSSLIFHQYYCLHIKREKCLSSVLSACSCIVVLRVVFTWMLGECINTWAVFNGGHVVTQTRCAVRGGLWHTLGTTVDNVGQVCCHKCL